MSCKHTTLRDSQRKGLRFRPGRVRPTEVLSFLSLSNAFVALCCVLLFLTAAIPAAAAPETVSGAIRLDKKGMEEARQSPWNIEAEKLSYDQSRQLYEAQGEVRVSSGDRIITADYAAVDMEHRRVDLWGNVTVQYGRNWLKGEHVIWNLDSETGWLDSGVVFFSENNFFVQGQSIAKTGPTEFELQRGFLTSCNPSDPDWKIQYEQAKINVGGVAWAKDSSVWARNIPVAFFPILGIPVEQNRQSGFLLPWAGNSSLNGFDFELPYYWAIRDDMDATLYGRYMEKRGEMGGAEYRINNAQYGKGVLMFNYLDDHADRGFLTEKGYPFQTEDRYWFRDRYDATLPWNVKAKVDLDFVSDRYFLQEFNKGSVAFGHTDKIFQEQFGRGILYDATSLVRESTIYLEKSTESSVLSMDARYFQQLEKTLDPITVQKLPSFSFTSIPKWIDGSPFYYTVESSAVNYWRRQGDTEQRLDIHPRIYYPMHWGNYLDIEPSAGFRTSSYAVEWDNKDFDTFNQRTLGDAKVEMSTRLNRVFPVDFGSFTAVQHSFRPEVSYEYATENVQGNIPHLDQLDQNLSRNGIRYGFSTFLTAKQETTDAKGNPVTSYREWVRFKAFQFFNVEKPPLEETLFDTQVMKDGFSPVGIRLDILPKEYITLSYDVDFDYNNTGQGDAHDLYMTLDSGRGHILRVDYQKRPDLDVNEITAETLVKTFGNLYLNTYHDYTLQEGILFKQGYGFRYFRGCWGIGVAYEREGGDNRVVVSLDLLGLGSIGRMPYLGRAQYGEPYPQYQKPETWMLSK